MAWNEEDSIEGILTGLSELKLRFTYDYTKFPFVAEDPSEFQQQTTEQPRNTQRQRHNAWRKAPRFAPYDRNFETRRMKKLRPMGGIRNKPHRKPLLLMDLPVEIRLIILEDLFSSLDILSWMPIPFFRARGCFNGVQAADNPLAILLTCRELYFEGLRIFQRNTLFESRLGSKMFNLKPEILPAYLLVVGAPLGFAAIKDVWAKEKYQRMPPNVKYWKIQILNPGNYLSKSSREGFKSIMWVYKEYGTSLSQLIQRQAEEALRDGNMLKELTIDLEAAKEAAIPTSTQHSEYFMKKYAIDALEVFIGRVQVMRITGEIPESLKDYARNMEIFIQGYDDTPAPEPVPVEEVVEKTEDAATVT